MADKPSIEQKATNKDLEAQALVTNEIGKGIFVFKAQELLKENEELFLTKKYSKIFRNIQRINHIVEREEKAVLADKASYHQEWLLALLKTLMKQKQPELAKKVNRDIESIGLALETKDLSAAQVSINKAVAEAMALPKETLMDWHRNTVVDLNLRVDELMDLLKGRQEKFRALKENPMDILRNYLEEILTLVAYEDASGIREPVERAYSYIWQIRRFLEQYETRKMPEDLHAKKEALELEQYRFIKQLEPFSKKYDVGDAMRSVLTIIKRASEDYTEGYINRFELKDELDKAADLAEKKRQQVHEEVALQVMGRVQKQIDTVRSWDMDTSLAQSICNQLTEAYGRKDYEQARKHLKEVKSALANKKAERLKGSALALIEPVEAFITSVEDQGVDVSEARTLLAMALDHVEREEFDMVERRALEAREKAAELKKVHFSGEVGKTLYDLNKEIVELKKEGKDVSKAELNLRQSRMMMEANNLEKAREYIDKVREEVDNLQLDLKAKPKKAPDAPKEGKQKPRRKLSAEELEEEKVLLGQITQSSLELSSIDRFYGSSEVPVKILEKAKAGMDAYDFKRVRKLLDKYRVRSRQEMVAGMRKMINMVRDQGVETEYLEFVLNQTAEMVEKGDLDPAEEYLESLRGSLGDFALPGEDGEQPAQDQGDKCPKCGADFGEDDVFCSKCGHKLAG